MQCEQTASGRKEGRVEILKDNTMHNPPSWLRGKHVYQSVAVYQGEREERRRAGDWSGNRRHVGRERGREGEGAPVSVSGRVRIETRGA
jgi:hypothetical protein